MTLTRRCQIWAIATGTRSGKFPPTILWLRWSPSNPIPLLNSPLGLLLRTLELSGCWTGCSMMVLLSGRGLRGRRSRLCGFGIHHCTRVRRVGVSSGFDSLTPCLGRSSSARSVARSSNANLGLGWCWWAENTASDGCPVLDADGTYETHHEDVADGERRNRVLDSGNLAGRCKRRNNQ